MSEEHPEILKNKIAYNEIIESNLKPENDLVLNQEYEVPYLIERMITLSDNISFNLLVSRLPEEWLKKTHDHLGLIYPSASTPKDFISVKAYSSIFRVLYNSSYLHRKSSEHLLSILNKTDFNDGLKKELPKDIPISHKFGILNRNNEDKQLHDCGIIYYPEKPYLLCVMTRGKNLDELKKIIGDISKEVYSIQSEN